MNVKQELLDAGLGLTEEDFDSHESDLYVRCKHGVRLWLRENYEFYRSVRSFVSQIDTQLWLDIPFAHEAHWEAKQRTAK